jgi:gas vesicle protein
MKKVMRSALKTALYLMDLSDQASTNVRDRVADQLDDVKDQAKRTYAAVADRVGDTTRSLRGENHAVRNALVFAGGVGAGVALGVIFAPASGQNTRQAIVRRFEDVGSMVRDQVSSVGRAGSSGKPLSERA